MEEIKTTSSMKKVTIGIAILLFVGLGWNYTEAIKAKNEIEKEKVAADREKIESDAQLKREELEQEQRQKNAEQELEQAKLDRELEADCQKQLTALRLRFNNVEGGGYNPYGEYCEVKYRDDEGEIVSGNIKNMVKAD